MAQRQPARTAVLLAAIGASILAASACRSPAQPASGYWSAHLDSPGGELPFGLELRQEGDGWSAAVINGGERRPVPRTGFDGGTLTLGFDSYGSEVTATLADDGRRLDGRWRRKSGPDRLDELAFHAVVATSPLPGGDDAGAVAGRWRVDFDGDELAAVGLFGQADDGSVQGTFRTATGDYRYLGGEYDDDERRLRLSVFDGAHAFLFLAHLDDDGRLAGDFWSRASWHQTWTAVRDDAYELPDPFAATRLVEELELAQARFPDLDGRLRGLTDDSFSGAARIVEIFGTWCPNCDDATRLLVELDVRYRAAGLRILGLAFEMTGDAERDMDQVRVYMEHHGIEYPVLLAGTADKQEASTAFPWIDRVRAYPTFLFLDGNDRVRAIYTGFDGPATGEAHRQLRERFELLIEEILETYDPLADDLPRWM